MKPIYLHHDLCALFLLDVGSWLVVGTQVIACDTSGNPLGSGLVHHLNLPIANLQISILCGTRPAEEKEKMAPTFTLYHSLFAPGLVPSSTGGTELNGDAHSCDLSKKFAIQWAAYFPLSTQTQWSPDYTYFPRGIQCLHVRSH